MTSCVIKKNDFEFSLPANFEIVYQDERRVQAICHSKETEQQPATLDIQLAPLSHIENCTGTTFTEKVEEYCKQYESQTLSIDSGFQKGLETYFLKLKIDTTLSDKTLKVDGLFAILLLDPEFCLVFSSMFDSRDAELFEVVTKTTLDSIEVVGKAASRANSFKEFAEKMERLASKRSQSFDPRQRLENLIIELDPASELKDLQTSFTIQDHELDAIHEKSSISINKSSRKLFAQFTAHVKKSNVADLIDDYYNGEITVEVSINKAYQNQQPVGQFKFEDGSTGAPLWLSLHCRGIDSSFKFFGIIDLIPGWLICRGVLAKKYDESPNYELNICFPFDANKLDWPNYEFSLDEALSAPMEQVRYLTINDFNQSQLPDQIFQFIQLRHLAFYGHGNDSNHLIHISEKLGVLTRLERLNISGTAIQDLPKEIGLLKNLTDATFMNNRLSKLPIELLNISTLEKLHLRNNQLTSLPDQINLPNLHTLDLGNNHLKTLPTSIARLPSLKELALYENPLEKLPTEINDITKLDLEIDQKLRLLDFTYPGADGKGMVDWADEIYFARSDKKLLQQLDFAVDSSFLKKYRRAFRHIALKSICIKTSESDDYSNVGNTRFGGLPDLPPEIPYPTITPGNSGPNTGSQFVAQLNCTDLKPFQQYLPRHGILYFFIDDQESFDCKVFYQSDTSQLISASKLEIDHDFIYDDHGVVEASRATFSPMISVPHFYNDGAWYTGDADALKSLEESGDDEYEQYLDVRDEFSRQLGVIGETGFTGSYYPDNHHAINTYMFSQGQPAQVNAANTLKGKPEDWIILLKVYSDSFCFWDSGEIAFVIHKSDLAKCDFSNVICCLESS